MGTIARRTRQVRVLAFAAVLAGISGAPAEAQQAPPPPLRVEESLARSLKRTGGRVAPSIEVRESLSLRASVRVPLESADPATFDADTLVGLRVDDLVFETDLGSDPRWRPGRNRAAFRVETGTAESPVLLRVKARWDRGELRLSLRASGRAPVAEDRAADPAGPVVADVDAAARLGAGRWRFGGEASGTLVQTPALVLGEPVALPALRLAGEGRLLAPEEDATPPAVVIDAPAGPTVAEGTVTVEGTFQDDRTVERVTWSVNGGAETDAPFATDPDSGFLTDILGSFSFAIPANAGLTHLVVRTYDAGGNVAEDTSDYLVTVPRDFQIAAGFYSAALTDFGDLVAQWGTLPAPTYFGFPINYTTVKEPTPVVGLSGVIDLAVGESFTLALLGDGTVQALGRNDRGQLGDGTITGRLEPLPVPGLDQVVDVAAGNNFSVALRADGSVWTWGAGNAGSLGNGKTGHSNSPDRLSPGKVEGIPAMKAVVAGSYGVLALDDDDAVWGWATAVFTTGTLPAKAPDTPASRSVSIGNFAAGVALDGTVWARGTDWYDYGILGGASAETGWIVPGISGAREVACGSYHTLVLLEDGTVVAFGNGSAGQLGDGTQGNRATPLPVNGLSGVRSVAAGYATSYAVLDDGSLRAWGMNYYAQVGDGTTDYRVEPVVIAPE